MLDLHLFEVHLQLFGDQHWDGGVGALAHLDIRHGQDNLPFAIDADEGVRHEIVGVSCIGFAVGKWQAQAQHQATAGSRSDPKKTTARERFGKCRQMQLSGVRSDANGDQCQPH